MTKVYAIEQGSYSDYRVVGVFSTRENAQTVVDYMKANGRSYDDDAEIAEWDLDPSVDGIRQGLFNFHVIMKMDTGDTVMVDKSSNPVDNYGDCVMNGVAGVNYNGHCWATDENHAIKIINERRIMRIAAGPTP